MRGGVCGFWLGGILLSVGVAAQQPIYYPDTLPSSPEAQSTQLRRIILEQSQQLQQFREEIQRLSGELEVLRFNQEQAAQRQRDVQADFDARLAKQEKPPLIPVETPPDSPVEATVPSTPPVSSLPPSKITSDPANTPPPPAASPPPPAVLVTDIADEAEKIAYEQAFSTLQAGRYNEAIAAFQAFLKANPKGRYADNAQYWIGESYYAMREFPTALDAFDKLLLTYPNSAKRAHALLKMGYVYAELNDKDKARQILEEVRNTYPSSATARLAEERLQRLGP